MRGPNINQWTINDGSDSDFWRASKTLSQRIMGTTTGTATAKFDLSGLAPYQLAGFVRYAGVYNLLGIEVRADGEKHLFFMNQMAEKAVGQEIIRNSLYIKTSNRKYQATYLYSLDGANYESSSQHLLLLLENEKVIAWDSFRGMKKKIQVILM